jgi:hypothetical protein
MGLTTREAYLVIRQEVNPERTVWLAWIGLGSALTPVDGPSQRSLRSGKPATRRASHGRRVPRGSKSFDTREAALEHGIAAWRANLARRVAAITRARGGTLDWGVPVEPLAEPIIIEPGRGESAWDVAKALPRRAGEGMAAITGLRPSGECL